MSTTASAGNTEPTIQAQVQDAISQQEARKATYEALRERDLPIPLDLREDFQNLLEPDDDAKKTRFRLTLENASERIIFASRWALAPLYLGLAIVLIVMVARFCVDLWAIITLDLNSESYEEMILKVLNLLDITLLANLVLIVIFAGYETFVSKIDVARNSKDRPSWMGKIDFSGMKIKLIGSLVAISLISLLQDFLRAGKGTLTPNENWRIVIHIVFVTSGVLFALMDWLSMTTLYKEFKITKEFGKDVDGV